MSVFKGNVWEGVYSSFAEAAAVGAGFNGETWLDRSFSQAQQELANFGSANDVASDSGSNRSTHLPELLESISAKDRSIHVLDFGGGMALTYLTAKRLTSAIQRYTIVDLPSLCNRARPLFRDFQDLEFGSDLRAYAGASPDVLYSNSAIQYVEDWSALIEDFARIAPTYILLDEAYVGSFEGFVTCQTYYDSVMPHRFFNFDELVSKFTAMEYELVSNKQYPIEILGKRSTLPMENFPEACRLDFVSSLLFRRMDPREQE